MKLYLVQHAKAVDKDVDAERPLSAEGKEDMKKVGAFLKAKPLSVARLWHSRKLRAGQTADVLAKTVEVTGKTEERKELGPNDDVRAVADELNAESASIMLVGHMPFVGRLASLLLTGSEQAGVVRFTQGCVVCLGRDQDGKWLIEWMITPETAG